MANEFGEILKRLRHDRNFTQSEAAEIIDISLRHYQGLEAGENGPGFEIIKKTIKGFKIEPNEIFGLRPISTPSPTEEKLIEALETYRKENEVLKKEIQSFRKLESENKELKHILSLIPPEWLARLAVKGNKDFGAIAARAFLTGDLSEIRALKLPVESKDILAKLVGKNGL